MADIFWIMEATADDCIAEFWINDLPIARRGKEYGFFHGAPVNEYLRPGTNELSMVVYPGKGPGRSVAGPRDGRRKIVPDKGKAEFKLSIYPRGAIVGGPDRNELVSFSWEADGEAAVVVPLVRTVEIDLDPPFGPWAWEEFEPLTLDETTRFEIDKVIRHLHLALSGGLSEPFIEMSTHRFADIEAAHYLPKGDRAAEGEKLFPFLMDRPDWAMEPLASVEPDIRLVGRSRLVEICDAKGSAVLRQQPDEEGNTTLFRMMLGYDGSDWQIVR